MKILFVCTGNTCRSAMAEALAKKVIAENGLDADVSSAGVFADGNSPATPQAIEAARKLGADLSGHVSTPITEESITEADIIYAMTNSHKDLIIAALPNVKDKIQMLDPNGSDIPDPYGAPQEVYDVCAEKIEDLVRERLCK